MHDAPLREFGSSRWSVRNDTRLKWKGAGSQLSKHRMPQPITHQTVFLGSGKHPESATDNSVTLQPEVMLRAIRSRLTWVMFEILSAALWSTRERTGAPRVGNDIICVCDHTVRQTRNVESGLLGERGSHTPQPGSDHTWEHLTLNQEKSLVCVWEERAGGSNGLWAGMKTWMDSNHHDGCTGATISFWYRSRKRIILE